MVRVFLTGGTGFIGRPLVKALQSRGWGVTVLARRPDSPQAQGLTGAGTHLAKGDVTDRESMRAAMSGAEIVVYVSTLMAFGDSGFEMRDETFTRKARCRTAYEKSKTDAHDVACRYRQRGLPLVIVCPSAVIGANDHSAWGYFQRLYLNRMMPPVCWSPGTVLCCVDVNDLAEGIALAAEKGRTGETYFLGGEAKTFREILNYWRRRPGAFRPVVWLPAGLAAALFSPLEPLQRMLGLPAFISRETVLASATNLNYSAEKAKRELGWSHRTAEEMRLKALDGELRLLSLRKGRSWVERLRPLESGEEI